MTWPLTLLRNTALSTSFAVVSLLLLTVIACTETTKAQSFSTPMTYSVGDNPNFGTYGDFNGDSKPDLAIGNVRNSNVSILLNTGDGTFNIAVDFGVDLNPESLATGDFNRDGKLDLAVGNFFGGATSTGNVSILLGNGNGTFATAVNYDASSPISLRVADLNADGKLDLAAASWTTNKASVLLGNGDGTFQSVTTFSTGTEPRGISIADFNGVGKPDLAVTNIFSNNVSILLGIGDGTFQAALNTLAEFGPIGIAASDLNGDAKQDMIVAAVFSDKVLAFMGNGDGSFQTPVPYAVGDEPQRLDLADFNGDGTTDVVVVNANDASVSFLRGNSDGTFQSAVTRPAQLGSFTPVASDFDTDGKPDLAIVSNAFDVVDVLLNSPSGRSVAISATAAAPAVGVLVATFKDYDTTKTAGSFTATVNWGDSTAPTAGTIAANGSGGFNVTGTHTYASEGSYSVNVQIADTNGNFASVTSTATVADAPLTATGRTISVNRGAAFTAVVASFTDADPAGSVGDFSATIGWGDGGSSVGTITADGSGGFNVSGSHTYNASGAFPIVVMIQDVGGSTATANSTANVIPPGIQFSLSNYTVGESGGSVQITVVRIGDTTGTPSVDYETSDQGSPIACATVNGKASSRCDFTNAVGSLRFAAGETSKTFNVLISQDSFVEGAETISLTLSNVNGDGILGTPATATLTIADDATEPATNPIDVTESFVRQHYRDFLNREPDAAGLAFWAGEIENCTPKPQCTELKRINVSAAFFLSIEFQETGYLVERMYKTAYGDTTSPNVTIPVPIIRLHEFLPDAQRIGQGVEVGVGDWQLRLEANKSAYAREFVVRPEFVAAYPLTMSATEFVNQLDLRAGGVLSAAERAQLIEELNGAMDVTQGRASVTRKVAEDADLRQREFNRAFVLMQYYGYMGRNPDDPQDTDFRGWEFWLDKLNRFNGNFANAEMVKAFILSIEYRQRFGP